MKINSADPNKQIEKFDINVISIKDLIDLSNRALNIDELTSFSSRSSSYKEHKKAEQLLERWEKLIEIRTEKKNNLDHRLALMGLDRSQMLEKLQTQCELQPEDIPVWGTQLGKILNNTAYSPWIENLLANLENSNELLFPEFLHPFIAYYLEELTLFHPDWELLVELPALKQLAVYLLSRLSHLCGRTVAYEIKQQDKLGLLARKTPQERYQYYTKELLGNTRGLFDFLNRYPVLGRLLSIVTDQAIQNTIKWFTRLKGDRTAIATTFTEDKELGKVVSLQPGLSDPHNGGETVWFVSFACGLKLAYKPRSLAIDVAYHKLLKWFNSLSSVPSLRAASVLARQGYGWVAWIETTECKDRKEVSQYYQRQGAHLALFYFLCGNDFHEDNFLPAGAYPIPIDLETIAALALSFNSSEEI